MNTQTPDHRSRNLTPGTGELRPSAVARASIAFAFTLMLVALWALLHRYQGLSRDGELYAVQALARIHPALGTDLYLRNTSQDQFTIFSRIYASFIRVLGLQNAELFLFVLCKVCFLGASWVLARALIGRDVAWLTVAILVITIGYYGSYEIFQYSEDYLTARSMGEAMVVASLACHFNGRRRLGLWIAIGALFIHPLMALPGVLLLICLWLPIRHALIGSLAGILATLSIAIAALIAPANTHMFTILDPAWLEVVRERSQFLFLKYWTTHDWELNARPFVSLTVTALAIHDEQIRKLCVAAMLVGASGLAVALISSAVGPVAILLQGQTWRWDWITGFVSVVLLAPTVLRVWRDEQCGPACAVLLVAAWTCFVVDGLACTEAALILWLVRSHISDRVARYLRWAAAVAIVLIVAWILTKFWTSREPVLTARIRGLFGLGVPAVLLMGTFWYWILSNRSVMAAVLASAALLGVSVCLLPGSFRQQRTVGTPAAIEEFADWRAAIPPFSNVLIIPPRTSASFAWFTLERTSYLSVDQSAGVVFSRATALEVQRRSEVLRPLIDPDWEILTDITERRAGKRKGPASSRPLTPQALIGICGDPQLGFVIAKEALGFDSIRHGHAGMWKDWSLYDCRHVRSLVPTA